MSLGLPVTGRNSPPKVNLFLEKAAYCPTRMCAFYKQTNQSRVFASSILPHPGSHCPWPLSSQDQVFDK